MICRKYVNPYRDEGVSEMGRKCKRLPEVILFVVAILVSNVWADGSEPSKFFPSNEAFMASLDEKVSAPDVTLPEGADLLEYSRQAVQLAPGAYSTPLIIPASDASPDSAISPYFFSFLRGQYSATGSSACHMAPAYLPFSTGASSVTVDNFFIFAYDNNGGVDTTYNLWRKATLSQASPQLMATVSTTGALSSIQVLGDTSVENALVTSDFAYYITWCFSSAELLGIQGFWIYYTTASN